MRSAKTLHTATSELSAKLAPRADNCMFAWATQTLSSAPQLTRRAHARSCSRTTWRNTCAGTCAWRPSATTPTCSAPCCARSRATTRSPTSRCALRWAGSDRPRESASCTWMSGCAGGSARLTRRGRNLIIVPGVLEPAAVPAACLPAVRVTTLKALLRLGAPPASNKKIHSLPLNGGLGTRKMGSATTGEQRRQ